MVATWRISYTTDFAYAGKSGKTSTASIQMSSGEDLAQDGEIHSSKAISTATKTTSVATGPEPQFPAPSQCSKWLLLFWFAGFSTEKIRWLLSQYYKLDAHKAYNIENIPSTFRKLQRSANRSNPDYMHDPYMWHLMTTESSSPIAFRASAVRWLEKHHPQKAAESVENEEIIEMNLWHDRWMEEVHLMERSKAEIYRARAAIFKEKLDQYSAHFKGRSHIAYLEEVNPNRPSSRTTSPTRIQALTRKDNEPVTTITRPVLNLRTKFNNLIRRRSSEEGTPTPGAAQHLDELGFFAQRPKKPNADSPMEAVSRSTSRPTSPDSSKMSLSIGPGSSRQSVDDVVEDEP